MRATRMAFVLFSLSAVNVGMAQLPTVGTTAGLGVTIHFTGNQQGSQLDMIKAAGLSFVRTDLTWSTVETTPGVYDFTPWTQLYASCASRGLRNLFILDYGNSLYGTDPGSTTWVNGFAAFAQAAAKQFKGDNVMYELYQEPDNAPYWPNGVPSTSQYMALVKAAAPVMRTAGFQLYAYGALS